MDGRIAAGVDALRGGDARPGGRLRERNGDGLDRGGAQPEFPDEPAELTVSGDVAAGERIYRTCGACHGWDGQGIFALNAPRQAGMSDWYLVNQLKNFRAGIRGAHTDDKYGMQMRMMAAILQTDEQINNVIAYINTLPGPQPEPNLAATENH